MPEKFRFFDPVETSPGVFDREYNAQEYAEYFATLINTGIMKGFGSELEVTADGASMETSIDSGIAFINGRYYESTGVTHEHDLESIGVNRIDRIVVRLDNRTEARHVLSFIKKGNPASSPVAPSLTRTNEIYELSLARVYITGGQSFIEQEDITDERGDEILCPYASSNILPNIEAQDFVELENAFNAHKADYVRQPAFAATTGTSTAYAVTLNPAPISIVEGFGITIVPHVNSGTNPTLNINGLGAIALRKQSGEAIEMVANTPYTFKRVGTDFLADSSGGLDEFFGDGSDGALNTSGNVNLTSTLNGAAIVRQYTSITINAGHTLTTTQPCQGLVLYSQGDVVINGTINMNQKAGLAPSANIIPMVITKNNIQQFLRLSTLLQNLKGGNGGNGGFGGGHSGSTNRQASTGSGGSARQNLGGFGGGGSGGSAGAASIGGIGGSIERAELGGGDMHSLINPGTSNIVGRNGFNGAGGMGGTGAGGTVGKGGKCLGGGGGGSGGASSNPSTSGSASDGQYAGGFILIIAKGNIVINGNILANGGNGGNGSNSAGTGNGGGGGGGGGAGGGVVSLLHKGTYTNNGLIQVNGGAGGGGGFQTASGEAGGSGTSGSVGTIHIQQL